MSTVLIQNAIIPEIVEQHGEEAAFLWLLRDAAAKRPDFTLEDIVELDSRVEANIDGTRIAGAEGWNICCSALELREPGEVFAAGVLALEGDAGDRLQKVVEVAAYSRENFRGLISAFGWVASAEADKWIRSLVSARAVLHRAIGLSAMSINRRKMGDALAEALRVPKLLLHGRALRAVGELKRRDLVSEVKSHQHSEDEPSRFWSAWSLAVLGDKYNGETLQHFVESDTRFANRAIQIAPHILDPSNCQSWLRELAQQEALRRYALIGCGISGDAIYIPTLINQMAIPEYARIAGESFSMITGVDLAYENLDADQPEDFEAGPTEDPADEEVTLDPDEDLPWPNPDLVDRWWHEHRGEYQNGVRYLCGQPISDANCRRVLREGYQRQRISAAYELALMNPEEPLFEWRAPGWRQQERLGLRRPPQKPASHSRAG